MDIPEWQFFSPDDTDHLLRDFLHIVSCSPGFLCICSLASVRFLCPLGGPRNSLSLSLTSPSQGA